MTPRHRSPWTRTAPRRLVATVVVSCVVAAACGSGKSATDAGEDEPASTEAAPATEPSASDPDQPATTDDAATPATEPPATLAPTTTTAPLADLPPCPVDALPTADAPIEITFWHGMTNELENALVDLTNEYNASQSSVVVDLENQTAYETLIDKYIQSSESNRPNLVQVPEFVVQPFAQSDTFVPIGACLEAAGFDTSSFLERPLRAYSFEGVQWGMPFNASSPVLFYNKKMFEAAGLDPAQPPLTLDEVRAASQQLIDSGAAAYGLVVDTGRDSAISGGSFEQWFGRALEPYADNDNGRSAPATEVYLDSAVGQDLLTWLRDMHADGLSFNAGENPGGQETFFKMADPEDPAAMTISTSAAIGSVVVALGSGLVPGLTEADVGVGFLPGPGDEADAQVGGASLWIPVGGDDAEIAATWEYIEFLVDAQNQSSWADRTGYVPIRFDAADLDPVASTYATDPRFRVSFDQLSTVPAGPAAIRPLLGPQREIRDEVAFAIASVYDDPAADVATLLATATANANALIADYNARS